MCLACREMKPKNTLLRVVNSVDGVKVDLSGKLNGRGAYICKSEQCLNKAKKAKTIERQFEISDATSVYNDISLLINQE